MTKTTDQKGTFLNVLADAVENKYPDCLPLRKDLPHIHTAAKGRLRFLKFSFISFYGEI